MKTEKRFLSDNPKLIIEGEEKEVRAIEGYALVFDSESNEMSFAGVRFRERIDARALDNTDFSDVVALFNHDKNLVLGRTSSGTLKLSVDERGLKYRINYDGKDEDHRKLLRKLEKRDIQGSSFAMLVDHSRDKWERRDGYELRTINAIKVIKDVSPVTYPAYNDTDVAKRSLEEYNQSQTEDFEAYKLAYNERFIHLINL